jgi:hypothetical protein
VVETALGALGIAHGKGGVQAAVDFIAEAVPPADLRPANESALRRVRGA